MVTNRFQPAMLGPLLNQQWTKHCWLEAVKEKVSSSNPDQANGFSILSLVKPIAFRQETTLSSRTGRGFSIAHSDLYHPSTSTKPA
ncbi:hypothetical protein EVAR_6822_1 [Eumeta japonica]|uniref:Uncharacterized protein n=1 Tax=Eumeta variegata TaxID=151549 RepID=A0A4C1U6E3_EUMVA|nr:hypothetical protein EVAR_6822_1 [Eumeta japonica]